MRLKQFTAYTICLLLLLPMGCAAPGSGSHVSKSSTGVDDVLAAAENAQPTNPDSDSRSTLSQPAGKTVADGVDVDLTSVSTSIAYSELYIMLTQPEEFIGKTVRMHGTFGAYQDPATNNYVFGCLLQDATACCAQGLEFVLAGKHNYPEDYPPLNSEITVEGVFETYSQNGYQYCTLKNASLIY